MIEYNDFINSKHPLLIKIATAYELYSRLSKIPNFFIKESFKYINKDIYQKLISLHEYKNKYIKSTWGELNNLYSQINKLIKDMDVLDKNIINDLEIVEEYSKDLNCLVENVTLPTYIKPSFLQAKYITLILKHHNKSINKYWYLKDELNPLWKELKEKEENV